MKNLIFLNVLAEIENGTDGEPELWKITGDRWRTSISQIKHQFRTKTIEGAWYLAYKYMLRNVVQTVRRVIDGKQVWVHVPFNWLDLYPWNDYVRDTDDVSVDNYVNYIINASSESSSHLRIEPVESLEVIEWENP
jgi:hypothetical protein